MTNMNEMNQLSEIELNTISGGNWYSVGYVLGKIAKALTTPTGNHGPYFMP